MRFFFLCEATQFFFRQHLDFQSGWRNSFAGNGYIYNSKNFVCETPLHGRLSWWNEVLWISGLDKLVIKHGFCCKDWQLYFFSLVRAIFTNSEPKRAEAIVKAIGNNCWFHFLFNKAFVLVRSGSFATFWQRRTEI